MDPYALTPSDEINRSAAEPQLALAVDANQRAEVIRSVEVAQGWQDSGNGLDQDTGTAIEGLRES